jgi:flagellar assembly protein FliH
LSNVWTGTPGENVQPVGMAGYAAAAGTGRFRALFADGQQMSVRQPMSAEPEAPAADPIDRAHAEGFAMGFEEGTRIATEAAADDRDAQIRLAEALEQLGPASSGTLATMLSAAVVRLVEQIVGEVAVDEDLLRARCETVAAFIDETEARSALHLNPADVPLISGADIAVQIVADPQMRRGCVRLDTVEGWIEDGPDVRLSRLRAMLDDMEGKL